MVGAITALGYDCRWIVISAASVGALHRRERWFLLAYSKHYGILADQDGEGVGESLASGRQQQSQESERQAERTGGLSADVANANENSSRRDLRELSKENESIRESQECRKNETSESFDGCSDVAYSISERLERQWNRTKCASEKQPMFTRSCNDGNTMREPSKQTDTETDTKQLDGEAWREHTGQYWPFESREHWQEVECEFCGVFNGISHKLDTNETEELNATETKRRSCKILSKLRSDCESKEIWESFRRSECFSYEKILFSELYGEGSSDRFPCKKFHREEIRKIQKDQLRNLQCFREFMSSSHRQESLQQRPLELADALLFMSYNFASSTRGYLKEERKSFLRLLRETFLQTRLVPHAPCSISSTWSSLSEEEKDWVIMASIFGIWWDEWVGVPRATADKIPFHVDRLKSLGNSVVPQQVKHAFKLLMGIE